MVRGYEMRKMLLKKDWYRRLEVAIAVPTLRFLLRNSTFQHKEYNLPYEIHPYNSTYANDRMIELPIIGAELLATHFDSKDPSKVKVLEIGNVLNHYVDGINHDVVDMNEYDPTVKYNVDIIDFKPKIKYDLVFSISTMEHIGFDEGIGTPKRPDKLVTAITQIQKYTKRFIFTFPYGFNKFLDYQWKEGVLDKLGFKTIIYKREAWNIWVRCQDLVDDGCPRLVYAEWKR
jgi:hypothetical protein